MTDPVVAFLPCRAGSERVKNKNTRTFAGVEGGLLSIKLRQLDRSADIDSIVFSTNDEVAIGIAEAMSFSKPIHIHRRSDALATSLTSTDDVILHALDLIREGAILWTHVTSPFVTGAHYDEAIAAYRRELNGGWDSLMSVTARRGFLWRKDGPVNYDRNVEKWPRTQTLEPLYEVNSAIFLCAADLMRTRSDRIGARPWLHELDHMQSTDIDWEEDFVIAELLAPTVDMGL